MTIEEPPDRARRKPLSMHLFQVRGDLHQRDIDSLGNQLEDFIGMAFDPFRPLVATLRARGGGARVAPSAYQLDRRRGRNPEPRSSGSARRTLPDGFNQTLTKVIGQRSCHPDWPPPPVHSMNHCSRSL
jgi:hypothetical protein